MGEKIGTHAIKFVLFAVILQATFILFYGLFVDYGEAFSGHHEAAVNGTVEIEVDDGGVGFFYPFFQDVNVMIFIGFGFLMTFQRKHGFGSVGFNLLLAAFTIQWSILVVGFLEQVDSDSRWHKIELNIEKLILADFAAGTVLVSFGAVLGKFSPFALLYMAFFEVIFYAINEWIGVSQFYAVDMGGSMFVHTFGAFFGVGVSLISGKKKTKCHPLNSSVYHSDLFAMIGTLFLWVFWPSFNGALASGGAQHRVIINTTLALTGSTMAGFVTSIMLRGGKYDMVDIQNATLAGGVAVGSSADLIIGPWASMLIGFLAGAVSVGGYVYTSPLLEKLGLQDTCGVLNLHGIPGIIGGVSGAISASAADEQAYGQQIGHVFPARAPSNATTALLLGIDEPGKDRTASSQAGYQMAALCVTVLISLLGGMLTGSLIFFGGDKFWEQPGVKAYQDERFWEVPDDADDFLPKKGRKKGDERQEMKTNGVAVELRTNGVDSDKLSDMIDAGEDAEGGEDSVSGSDDAV